jgi:hypothetical protein
MGLMIVPQMWAKRETDLDALNHHLALLNAEIGRQITTGAMRSRHPNSNREALITEDIMVEKTITEKIHQINIAQMNHMTTSRRVPALVKINTTLGPQFSTALAMELPKLILGTPHRSTEATIVAESMAEIVKHSGFYTAQKMAEQSCNSSMHGLMLYQYASTYLVGLLIRCYQRNMASGSYLQTSNARAQYVLYYT